MAFRPYRDRYGVSMSNESGHAMGISSCCDKEGLLFLLGQMCFLCPNNPNSLQKPSVRSLFSGFGLYSYSPPSGSLGPVEKEKCISCGMDGWVEGVLGLG